MPHSNGAKKRFRQDAKRRVRNRSRKAEIRTAIKRVLTAVEQKDAELARRELRNAQQKLDKAAFKRVLHPNTSARQKAALTRRVQALEAAASV